MKIPWLNFERWGYAGGRWFAARRIYRNGWKWTPFVWLKRRYGSVDTKRSNETCQY